MITFRDFLKERLKSFKIKNISFEGLDYYKKGIFHPDLFDLIKESLLTAPSTSFFIIKNDKIGFFRKNILDSLSTEYSEELEVGDLKIFIFGDHRIESLSWAFKNIDNFSFLRFFASDVSYEIKEIPEKVYLGELEIGEKIRGQVGPEDKILILNKAEVLKLKEIIRKFGLPKIYIRNLSDEIEVRVYSKTDWFLMSVSPESENFSSKILDKIGLHIIDRVLSLNNKVPNAFNFILENKDLFKSLKK